MDHGHGRHQMTFSGTGEVNPGVTEGETSERSEHGTSNQEGYRIGGWSYYTFCPGLKLKGLGFDGWLSRIIYFHLFGTNTYVFNIRLTQT
jgi:hypothetical protein